MKVDNSKIALVIALLFAIMLIINTACNNSQNSNSNYSPLNSEATQKAEKAATWLIEQFGIEHDVMKRQGCILQVRAMQSEYIIIGDTIAANTFQRSFINALRQQNDSIASLILTES